MRRAAYAWRARPRTFTRRARAVTAIAVTPEGSSPPALVTHGAVNARGCRRGARDARWPADAAMSQQDVLL